MLWWMLGAMMAAAAPLSAEDAQAILQIEAQRLPPLALQAYLDSDNPDARARAARALGRLRTSAALSPLRRLMEDDDPTVRAEAAFALGQTPGGGLAAQDRFASESDPQIRALLCEAMGKQGGSGAVELLVRELDSRPVLLERPVVAIAAARALGQLARREVDGIGAPVVISGLLRQLDRLDAGLRRAAAYGLSQIRPTEPPDDIAAALLSALGSAGDPEVRKLLLYATADIVPKGAQDRWYRPLLRDPSADVRVALARVSGKAGWSGVTALLDDRVLGVRLEAIDAVAQIEGLDHGRLLLSRLQAGATLEAAEQMRTEDSPALLEAAAALTALGTSPVEGVPALLGNADAYLQPKRPGRIRVAAAGLSRDTERLTALAREDGEVAVRTAAAFQLSQLEQATTAQMLSLLEAFDPVVVAVAAGWLAEHPTKYAEGPLLTALDEHDNLDVLTEAAAALVPLYEGGYPKVRRPDPRAAVHAQALLAHGDRSVYEAAVPLAEVLRIAVPPPHHILASAPLDEVAALRQARIETSRGTIIVTLYPDEAPLTVWNFAKLAESGFYDGLRVHRVIPDFVVQDGDPRGDGTGGPGWTIPDEINPVRYAEGTLGMAHAGPDTGGSQWFITLSPQPHLDGVHTVFGRVSRGQYVLRDVRPGDRIEHIVIERY